MASPVDSSPTPADAEFNKYLRSREEFQPCYIRVPDLNQRLAAITCQGKHYSFFKAVSDRQQAIDILARLKRRGDEAVVTQTPKGTMIWVWEPDAIVDTPQAPRSFAAANMAPAAKPDASSATPQVLNTREQYRTCHIRVPGIDHRLGAIFTQGKYYSLFKVIADKRQVADMVMKLTHRREETLVTQVPKGYAIWVWEPDATPAPPPGTPG